MTRRSRAGAGEPDEKSGTGSRPGAGPELGGADRSAGTFGWSLVVRRGSLPPETVALAALPARIGSGPGVEVRLDDPDVPAIHGELALGEAGIVYRSRAPRTELALRSGDRFRVGGFVVRLVAEAAGGEGADPLRAVLDLLPRLWKAEPDADLGRDLLETLRVALDARWAALVELGGEPGEGRVVGTAGERLPGAGDRISRTVLEALGGGDAPVVANDVVRDERFEAAVSIPADVRSIVACRLEIDGGAEPGSVVYLESPRTRPGFTEPERLLLERLCRLVGEARARSRQTERLTALHQRSGSDARPGRGLIGSSPAMVKVRDEVRRAAEAGVTTLVQGETGTGKELVARALHAASARRDGPFVALNAAALPRSLAEAELFGHEKGAFSGADRVRLGRFELAEGGAFFLDEIGDLDLEVQAKLLRVLEARRFERVGGSRSRRFDALLVAASHRDLAARVAEGAFREDLFYRLSVFTIRLPPLRERREDLPELCEAILAELEARYRRGISGLDPEAEARLAAHRWPGNVRELGNVLEQGYVRADRDRITAADLGLAAAPTVGEGGGGTYPDALDPARALFERSHVLRVLREEGGDTVRAAARLGLSRSQVYRKCEALGIDRAALGEAGD